MVITVIEAVYMVAAAILLQIWPFLIAAVFFALVAMVGAMSD